MLKGKEYEKIGIGQLHIKKSDGDEKKILLIRAATATGITSASLSMPVNYDFLFYFKLKDFIISCALWLMFLMIHIKRIKNIIPVCYNML